MGILRVVIGDLRLGWDSPVREVVHPKYINLESRGGLGWLEGFNEFLARCGLEWAGHPGPDRFINNVGEQAEMNLTLHGKVENIPASDVEVIVEREPRPRIRVRGRVDERAFYGPKLELWTELSTEPGSATFRIDDTLTNRSAFESEFQILYHVNYGPPLLGAGAHFSAPLRRVTPFNARAAEDVATYADYAGPVRGFIEQVYNLQPFADRDGRSMMSVLKIENSDVLAPIPSASVPITTAETPALFRSPRMASRTSWRTLSNTRTIHTSPTSSTARVTLPIARRLAHTAAVGARPRLSNAS